MPILFLFSFLLLVSCGNPLSGPKEGGTKIDKDFHPGVPSAPPPDVEATIPANLGADSGFKLGAGAVRAAGAAIGMKAAITTTDRIMAGSHVKAKVSFSQRAVR